MLRFRRTIKTFKKMKKIISAAMAAACVVPSQAENTQTKLDTTNVQNISEVVVKAVRAPQSAPFAITNVQKQQLQDFAKSGKELPFSSHALRVCSHGARTAWEPVQHTCVCVALLTAAST